MYVLTILMNVLDFVSSKFVITCLKHISKILSIDYILHVKSNPSMIINADKIK